VVLRDAKESREASSRGADIPWLSGDATFQVNSAEAGNTMRTATTSDRIKIFPEIAGFTLLAFSKAVLLDEFMAKSVISVSDPPDV
jgi:hypothetical protein